MLLFSHSEPLYIVPYRVDSILFGEKKWGKKQRELDSYWNNLRKIFIVRTIATTR